MSQRSSGAPAQSDAGHAWAIVLAAGEGSRLRSLTTTSSGIAVPKQFCSLGGGASLLHDALRRAEAVAPPQRICAVVAEHHRQWWTTLPRSIPPRNVIVQPQNRGTANGILLPLLQILQWDPQASLLVLPSDHYVRDEPVLAGSLRRAVFEVEHHPQRIVLLGLSPQDADPELGYIVAEAGSSDVREVGEFIEKPSPTLARALIQRGGLWNAFIFAANGQALLRAFERRCPHVVHEMRRVIESTTGDALRQSRLRQLYDRLPALDFSRDVVEQCTVPLRVLVVPPCGWSDLGTPQRVGEAVSRERAASDSSPPAALHARGFLDLAAQHARLRVAG
jgi:mannose-1-phosphate guanylyltransferase